MQEDTDVFAGYQKGKWAVYLLRKSIITNVKSSGQGNRTLYVGMTNNLPKRVQEHNAGKSRATAGFEWELVCFAITTSRSEAASFEGWLKVGDTKRKRAEFEGLFGAQATCHTDAGELFIKKALLWKATQQLRTGIFKGVRGNG